MSQPGWESTSNKQRGTSGGFVADSIDYPKKQLPAASKGEDNPSEPFTDSTKHFQDDKLQAVKSRSFGSDE